MISERNYQKVIDLVESGHNRVAFYSGNTQVVEQLLERLIDDGYNAEFKQNDMANDQYVFHIRNQE